MDIRAALRPMKAPVGRGRGGGGVSEGWKRVGEEGGYCREVRCACSHLLLLSSEVVFFYLDCPSA